MGHSQESKSDLKVLFRKGGTYFRRCRAIKSIIKDVFDGDSADFMERLEDVLIWLEAAFWQDISTKSVSDSLLKEMSAEIHHRGMFALILDVRERSVGSESSPTNLLSDMPAELTREALRPFAWRWLYLEFMRYTGASIERSMHFALFLLECIGRGARATSAAANLEEASGMMSELHMQAHMEVIACCSCPPHKNMPQKQWLECLIEHADQSGVDDVLDSVMNVFTALDPEDMLRINFLPSSINQESVYSSRSMRGEAVVNHILQLSQQHEARFLTWREPYLRSMQARKERGKRVLAWAQDTEKVEGALKYIETCEAKARSQPSRGIRPGGFDHVDIRVSPLWNAGIRSIIFHPEGCTFPDVVVEILTRKETPHLVSFRINPKESSERKAQYLFDAVYNAVHPETKVLQVLLSLVIADAFYRIVLQERPLREKSQSKSLKEDGEGQGAAHPVAPHPRRLQPGHKASVEARAGYEACFSQSLPEGFTFVAAHYSKGRLVYDMPTTAFATYNDDDLFEIGNQT